MKLLDLFCGGGGASMGYSRAGFDVTGVDILPQKSYPFPFNQADAMEFSLEGFDAIHASPPCHQYSTATQHRKNAGIVYPDLLGPIQERLRASGKPYIIENVPGAKELLKDPIMLCGGMFSLGVMRHRYFESNLPIVAPPHTCNGNDIDRDAVSVTRHGPPVRWYRKNPGAVFNIKIWHDAMGIDWMPRGPLTQSIPPAYTQYLGQQLLQLLS